MPTYALVKDGDQIGYVDTDNGEAHYTGDDPFERGAVENMHQKNMGSPANDWDGEETILKGDRMEKQLKQLIESDEIDFDIVER